MRTILFFSFVLPLFIFALPSTPAERSMENEFGNNQKKSLTISKILNLSDGSLVIVLSDGSKWQVSSDDDGVDKAGGWLGPAPVEIKQNSKKDYSYTMYNTWTGSSVDVKPYKESTKASR